MNQNTEPAYRPGRHRTQNPVPVTVQGNTDNGTQTTERFSFIFALCSLFFVLSCASPSKQLPPPPPKYVYQMEEEKIARSTNSLWNDSINIFEDRKARRLNDLVTIKIEESLEGSGAADTDTSRESSVDVTVDELLGMNLDFNLHNAPILNGMYKGSNVFVPQIKGSAKSDFKGEGDTNREGELTATLTAKVVEVMPNGNLVLEARKELTINEERQILVLAGMVRPDDIESDNTISSTKIADAHVYYVGDGVINDKQKPGWLTRIVDNAWPF
jgi:flagellar L-ring protein precursor FlgH